MLQSLGMTIEQHKGAAAILQTIRFAWIQRQCASVAFESCHVIRTSTQGVPEFVQQCDCLQLVGRPVV